MDTATRERIQICRKCRDECFSFSSAHLRNISIVKNRSSDELHIEMSLSECTLRCLSHEGESLRQNLIENSILCSDISASTRGTSRCGDFRFELCGLRLELSI